MNILRLVQFAKRIVVGAEPERAHSRFALRMALRGIDLRGVSLSELGLTEKQGYWYGNSGGPGLDKILQTLNIGPSDAALDLGCGKGGAMITLARYSFSHVDGVEISPDLARICRRNLSRLRIHNATIICCDASQFTAYDQYTYLYMFNPFPVTVMEPVLKHLRASLEIRPRPLTLIYFNPRHHDCLISFGFHSVAEFHDASFPVRIYEAVASRS